MPTRSWVIPGVLLALSLVAGAAAAEAPNLGRPVGTADIAAWTSAFSQTAPACRQAEEYPVMARVYTLRSVPSAMARTAKVGLRA